MFSTAPRCPLWVLCNIPSLLTAVQSLLLPRAWDVHPWMLAWKIPAPYNRESRSCCSQGRQSRVSSVPCLASLSPLHRMDSLSVMCSTAQRHKPTPGMFLLSKYSQDDRSCLESKPNICTPEPLKLSRTLVLQQQLPGKVWGVFPAEGSVPCWLQRRRDFIRGIAGGHSKEILRLL